jgi:hypothetical protein
MPNMNLTFSITPLTFITSNDNDNNKNTNDNNNNLKNYAIGLFQPHYSLL